MTIQQAFAAVVDGRLLDGAAAESAFGEILDGAVPDAMVGGFLIALKLRGETAEELLGAVRALLKRARAVNLSSVDLLDTSGTGGDNSHTFNISTGAALIAAAAGVAVAKHGNRAISGKVGGADVLEHAGVRIDCDADGLARCLARAGICFIFAPAYQPALARFAPLRRALATRTLFNLAGPLCNPATPKRRLVGVADSRLVRHVADVLVALEVEHAMVIRGDDGVDEISIAAPTHVAEVRRDAVVREYQIEPGQFGITSSPTASLRVDDAASAARMLREALTAGDTAAHHALALNGGAAIYVGGKAATLAGGVEMARGVIDSGSALVVLDRLARASRDEESAEMSR
ncbi:MAG: anthranilate phosphoribosyltransferase [Candidatus Binataceae bacterium]